MGRTRATFVVAASLLTLASSEAAAWECRAAGLGSSGYARAYDIVDAKLFALRQCERRSPLPVCTLVWCRPGGSRIISTARSEEHTSELQSLTNLVCRLL